MMKPVQPDACWKDIDILGDEGLITIGVAIEKMQKCQNYSIPCPFALSKGAPVPCIGSQENCDQWRDRYSKYQKQSPKKKPTKRHKSRLEVLGVQDEDE